MSASAKYGAQGLTAQQVLQARVERGSNEVIRDDHSLLTILKSNLKDSMLLILLVATLLYFISGKIGDGFFYDFGNCLSSGYFTIPTIK